MTLYELHDPVTGAVWSLVERGPDLLLLHIAADAGPMASIPLPVAVLAALAAAPAGTPINDPRQLSIRSAA